MTTSISIDSIVINREGRQRRTFSEDDLELLANSIKALGLIQPIVIDRNNNLIAGERRLRAHQRLGLQQINVVYSDALDSNTRYAMELEENVKRSNLGWKDECEAYLRYHEFRSSVDTDWTMAKTAGELSISNSELFSKIAVAKELRQGNTLVTESPKYSTARGIVERAAQREDAAQTAELMHLVKNMGAPTSGTVSEGSSFVDGAEPTEGGGSTPVVVDFLAPVRATGLILNEDFLEWAKTYTGPKFNLIHCDFPYGVNADKFKQGSASAYGGYSDTPELYRSLLSGLLEYLDNFCEESAHLIFWFSMDYYQETMDALSTKFRVSNRPLIWHKSDGSGIIPDPKRGPRWVYETAFFASRGDRYIVRAVANVSAAGIQRGTHMSEKPQEVLKHFFRMVVDEHTTLLDPTAGSGSAVRAAASMGASRYLGLEINPEFAKLADELLFDQLNAEPDML